MSTQAGDIELKIPKLSHGSFFPSLLSPRRRIDQALHAVIMQAYVEGVLTRSVDDLVEALGIDSGVSKSEMSRICAKLDVEVDAFRNRSLARAVRRVQSDLWRVRQVSGGIRDGTGGATIGCGSIRVSDSRLPDPSSPTTPSEAQ